MTPTNQQDEQKSFRLNPKAFHKFRAAMKGKWKALFFGASFLILFVTIFYEDWKLGLCIYLSWISAIETAYVMDKNKQNL